jgi:hypothetical protein
MNVRTFVTLTMKKNPYLHKAKIGVIIFLIGASAACKKENRWDCIKRTGEQTTDTRILPPFTNIYLKDNIDVFITQGAVQEVKIVAGKNLVSLIKTEVINGELHLRNDNKCNWARSYIKGTIAVYITLPTISYIENDGSGNIKSQNTISCDNISMMTKESGDIELSLNATTLVYIVCLGSSDITLHGKTPTLGIYHLSEGYLYCQDIQTDNTWTESKASGNEYLNVKNYLKASIEWAGDVYYTGNPPAIQVEVNGKGKLIHQN